MLLICVGAFIWMRLSPDGTPLPCAPASAGIARAGGGAGTARVGGGATPGGGVPNATPAPTNAVAPVVSDADRFEHHVALMRAQQAARALRPRLPEPGGAAEARERFQEWALLLYRDSLRLGIVRRPPGDPVALELAAALRDDQAPRIDMVRKAELGPIPEARTTNLLSRAQALSGAPVLPEAEWMLEEFNHLLKKAKQRSDTFYMSEMKTQFALATTTVEAKLAITERFLAAGDVAMAEYPREHFDVLLQGNTLNPDLQNKVRDLLRRIEQARKP